MPAVEDFVAVRYICQDPGTLGGTIVPGTYFSSRFYLGAAFSSSDGGVCERPTVPPSLERIEVSATVDPTVFDFKRVRGLAFDGGASIDFAVRGTFRVSTDGLSVFDESADCVDGGTPTVNPIARAFSAGPDFIRFDCCRTSVGAGAPLDAGLNYAVEFRRE